MQILARKLFSGRDFSLGMAGEASLGMSPTALGNLNWETPWCFAPRHAPIGARFLGGKMDYQNLIVWQKSMDFATLSYKAARQLPKEELYSLSDQLRRAAVSVPSNIAEGYGRHSTKEYLHFLNIARGSLYEAETQLQLCERIDYISSDLLGDCLDVSSEIKAMLNSMISKVTQSGGSDQRPLRHVPDGARQLKM